MAIIFNCQACGKRFEVGDGLAGKRVRCKVCAQEMRVPGAPTPPPSPTPRKPKAPRPAPRADSAQVFDAIPIPPRATRPIPRATPAAEVFDAIPIPPRSPSRAEPPPPPPSGFVPEEFAPWRAPARAPGPSDRPTRRERAVEVEPLPGFVSIFLGLLGAVVLLGMVAVAVLGMVAGKSELVVLGVGSGIGVACSLFAMASTFRVVIFAARQGPLHLAGCLLVPGYMLFFYAKFWRETRDEFFTQLFANVVGAIFLFGSRYLAVPEIQSQLTTLAKQAAGQPVPPPGGPAPIMPQLPAGQQVEPLPGVILTVTDVPSKAASAVIAKKIRTLLDPSEKWAVSFSTTGRTVTYDAWPVADPEAFAANIDFGKVIRIDGRAISVQAGPLDESEVAAEANRRAEVDTQMELRAGVPGDTPSDALLEKAIAALRARDPDTRTAAARRLAELIPVDDRREEVQEALRPLLEDPSTQVAEEAIKAMVVWRTEATVSNLIAKVADPRPGVRGRAIESLGKLGDAQAAPAIASRLKQDAFKSVPALIAIGPAAEPAVLDVLLSRDPDVRREACNVLAEIGGETTLARMRGALPDPDSGVRSAAKEAMEAIADRLANPDDPDRRGRFRIPRGRLPRGFPIPPGMPGR